jgi:hypothetical protein
MKEVFITRAKLKTHEIEQYKVGARRYVCDLLIPPETKGMVEMQHMSHSFPENIETMTSFNKQTKFQ